MNELLKLMAERQSQPMLGEPAPSPELLSQLIAVALTAPDHGAMAPSRYLVIGPERRPALGELFVQAAQARDPAITAEEVTRTRNMPLRAPMLVIGICHARENPKVPLLEQQVSTGIGMGYLLLGLQAAGYGGMWRTGWMASDPIIREGLGLTGDEHLMGFLYVGTVTSPKRPPQRPVVADALSWW